MQPKFWNPEQLLYLQIIRKGNMEKYDHSKTHRRKFTFIFTLSLFQPQRLRAGFEQRQQHKAFYLPLSYLWLQTLTHH